MRAKRLLLVLAISAAAPAQAVAPLPPRPAAAAPDAFGSVALALGPNRYSERWQRVAASGAPGELARLVQPARALGPTAKAAFVNAALNQRIRYRFDTDPTGDRWASAAETLGKGAGDCEDYVIAKMHALKRLGVPARDLYMTIGQEGTAGAAHAVLLVRASGGLYVLDNRSDRLIPEASYGGFYPIISFSAAGGSWLHGYPRGRTPPAVRAMSQVFAQGRHVPLGSSEASRRRLAG
ncbi:MAG TPA: transglutaminase-like cysteine peptidase [Sphingomicrobium sp.]|nr:transglutaminase-like cysteine peptidase [Sphingomicrobium sp.]